MDAEMIFSGQVTQYKCPACGAAYSNVTPTSLIPMMAVIGVTVTRWTVVAGRFVSALWLSVVIGIASAVLCLFAVYWLVVEVTTRKLRRGFCLNCGARTEFQGHACYDGIVPNLWELFIYCLSIAVAFAAAHSLVGK
jgi:hypothetical protein